MEPWMNENFIKQIFQTMLGENVQVKVILDLGPTARHVKHTHTLF